jgi:imidazolonepropionase-like amidohydrolase
MHAIVAALALAAPADPPLVFRNVTVIDVAAGKAVPGRTVVVTGDRITAVAAADGFAPPAGARVIDGTGKFLAPGLWDAHAHVADTTYFKLFLANGVTAVRELHAFLPEQMVRYRDEIAAGKRAGPRMVVAGSLVDGEPAIWPGSLKATTPDEGRAAVRKLKGMRADLVKVYESLRPDVYRAIVAEAKAVGLPVDGHVPVQVSAREATDAGQRTIEHLRGVALASSRDEEPLRKELAAAMAGWTSFDYAAVRRANDKARDSLDPAKQAALFDAFKRNRTWHTPTLVVLRYLGRLDDPAFVADDRLKYLSPYLTLSWRPEVALQRFGGSVPAGARDGFEANRRLVRAMHAAGVGLLAGTDCTNPYCFPGFSLPDELELLVGCGLTPADALRTATLNPAVAFGLADRLGTVAEGKKADLLLLDADPLADIANVRRIAGVTANGRYTPGDELRASLAEVAKGYGKK